MQLVNGLIFIWGSELVLVAVLVLAYIIFRLTRQFQTTCFTAVASALCAILNPYVCHRLLRMLGVTTVWRIYFPYQYVVLLAAVVCGHVALRRIRLSQAALHGRAIARIGLILGYTWLACGLGYLLLTIVAWSSVW
jgi:hypothetical protein